MIKLRINPLSSNEVELSHNVGDSLSEIFDKAMESQDIAIETHEYFKIFVNGLEIDREFWDTFKPLDSEDILIATVARGGSFRETFKSVVIIAATVAGGVFGGPFGAAAAAILTSMLLNQLLPPIVPGLGDLGSIGSASSIEESQMYAITGQSNQTKKFSSVPQIYGEYKMFPYVAATPYTELETDSATGELVQFFVAVYDFGFGPLLFRDVKIGDTPISDYSDVEFRFVDLNKPTVSEGPWDDAVGNKFEIYKGDVSTEELNGVLNYNKESGASESAYRITRTFPNSSSEYDQELSLTFACTRGLTCYNSEGNRTSRNIELSIEFALEGTEDWKPYNDREFVSEFKDVGGVGTTSQEIYIDYEFINNGTPSNSYFRYSTELSSTNMYHPMYGGLWGRRVSLGVKKGTNYFYSQTSFELYTDVSLGSEYFGYITTKTVVGSTYKYELSKTFERDIVLLEAQMYYSVSQQDGGTDEYGNQKWNWVFGGLTSEATNGYTRPKATYAIEKRFTITGNKTTPIYASVKFKPKVKGAYKVRVDRVRSYSSYSFQIIDDLSLVNISTRSDRNPILTTKRHLFLELKIKATNQLNGSLNNLSAICKSVLDVYDPNTQTWSKKDTSNPAWIFTDLITGQMNKRALDKSRLDMNSIVEWANFCDQIPTAPPTRNPFTLPRYTCNFILDYTTTLQSILSQVTNSCQASLNVIDGKYGVLIDKKKTTPVQIFTPRNSWSFSSQRDFAEAPNAVKVKYVDTFQDKYELTEKIVYNDGFNSTNVANGYEEIQSFACNNEEQAWRFGRYYIAQLRLRKESISIQVDFEHLVCTRGDFVKVTQDVMRVGGTPARVKTVVGNRVTIDDGVVIITGVNYGYYYRSVSDGIRSASLTVVAPNTFDLLGDIPKVGDLIIIGEVDKVAYDCIVKSITPNNTMSATLLLVEKADAIHDAESTGTFPDYDPQIGLNLNSDLAAPPKVDNLIVTKNSWECSGSGYKYFIDLDWTLPNGAVYESFEIYVDRGIGYELVGYTNDSQYRFVVDQNNLGVNHTFKVLGLNVNGRKKGLGEVDSVTTKPVKKITPPSDIDGVFLNVTGETVQINWRPISDCDCREYLIRYSPLMDTTWEKSIPLQRVSANTTLIVAQARTGTYLIKAIDFNDNESTNCALASTSIPNLTNLNIIGETNDFPTLAGSMDAVVKKDNSLMIKTKGGSGVDANEYYPEGFYYFQNFLDLGEIYTVRLQSLVQAEGFTLSDMMSTWVTLEDVLALSSSRYSEWDVETQYRSTEKFLTMSEWGALSDINPISEGNQEVWTNWRTFTIGDFTGRIFQFRLKLISNKASVTPRVIDGVIRSDMPDRTESYNNIIVPIGGYPIVYNPAFKGPGTTPLIQITQDAMQHGDRIEIENRTLEGCTIKVYDGSNNPVSRQLDVFVKGYGRKYTSVI